MLKKPEGAERRLRGSKTFKDTSGVPEQVDWYAAGKVSESIDQGGCGACWAFTTATTLESLNAIHNNLDKVPKYSVQYLIDCDDIDWACDGGWMADAYDWTAENGIVNWDDYSRGYQGRKNRCNNPDKKKERFYNVGSNEEDFITNDRMKEIIAQQPAGVAIYSNFGCLSHYKSGVISEKDCRCSDASHEEVNHAVTVIGYGTDTESSGCQDYWLIKNSWGSKWGTDGHFKLCAEREGAT